LFEERGFNYVGPIDGHNIELLTDTFRRIKPLNSPVLIHVITQKGKGYEFSEKNPSVYHGIGPFKLETGQPLAGHRTTYNEVFGDTLMELAKKDSRIIAITAAMREGTGLEHFAKKYPERFYDVGIAEPHAVTFAAGLATQGLRPVVAIYSTFLQRAYDEIIHDVCLQNLPVVFAIDRAGIVGDDGPTHNGLFDLSFLRHVPNLVVMSPKDDIELRQMIGLALEQNGPVAIRYPRGKPPEHNDNTNPPARFKVGQAEILRDGKDVALLAIGNMVYPSLRASEMLEKQGISAMVINARFIKPLDRSLLSTVAMMVPRIVTVEENVLQGGFGSAVLEFLNTVEIPRVRIKRLGIPDIFPEQGSQDELRKVYGIDEEGIYMAVLSMLREPTHNY